MILMLYTRIARPEEEHDVYDDGVPDIAAVESALVLADNDAVIYKLFVEEGT